MNQKQKKAALYTKNPVHMIITCLESMWRIQVLKKEGARLHKIFKSLKKVNYNRKMKFTDARPAATVKFVTILWKKGRGAPPGPPSKSATVMCYISMECLNNLRIPDRSRLK